VAVAMHEALTRSLRPRCASASRFCTLRVRVVGDGSATGGALPRGVRMDWINWRERRAFVAIRCSLTALSAVADHKAALR
jgi:hypothetical protein